MMRTAGPGGEAPNPAVCNCGVSRHHLRLEGYVSMSATDTPHPVATIKSHRQTTLANLPKCAAAAAAAAAVCLVRVRDGALWAAHFAMLRRGAPAVAGTRPFLNLPQLAPPSSPSFAPRCALAAGWSRTSRS